MAREAYSPAGSSSSSWTSSRSASSSDGEEDAEDYCEGGYCPVSIGDRFNSRYVIVRKLGWGHFSTVWLARDDRTQTHVALKVVRAAASYTETAEDEIKLLQRLAAADPAHPGYSHVMRMLDHFVHRSPHGAHVCMVFEVLGESLMGLIDAYLDVGTPLGIVRQVAKQLLLGLDYMHRAAGLIHTDLKPENVLICVDDVEQAIHDDLARNPPDAVPTKFVRRSGSSGGGRGRSRGSGTELYITASQPLPSPKGGFESAFGPDGARSVDDALNSLASLSLSPSPELPPPQGHASPPPVIRLDNRALPAPGRKASAESPGTARVTVKIADIGNATPIEKHFSDDIQTRQYRSPEVIMGAKWGPSVDIWSAACLIFELITGGDILFQPVATEQYTKDDDHLAQIAELCGDFPRAVTRGAYFERDFFDARGALKNITRLRYWPLADVLREKYMFSRERANEIAAFLSPMLDLHPDRRATAEEMLRHPWLRGVVVQGELDAARAIAERGLLPAPAVPPGLPPPPVTASTTDMAAHTSKKALKTDQNAKKKKKKKK
ncbi:kinase-like protein [Auricularia subglabra TFB-10046 SS5]|nr:kinase-like protein [Auricularia subglabra TFB-10046 SS5]